MMKTVFFFQRATGICLRYAFAPRGFLKIKTFSKANKANLVISQENIVSFSKTLLSFLSS